MEFKLGHKHVVIRWQHHNPIAPLHRLKDGESITKSNHRAGSTSATIILRTEKKTDSGWGIALLHPNDLKAGIFSTDKGRKVALANALKNAMVNKRDRKIVWNKYHKQFGIAK